MNVFKCLGQKRGNLQCVYLKLHKNSLGETEHSSCLLLSKDQYNVYPEFNPHSGDVIYQTPPTVTKSGKIIPPTEVDPVGPRIIWENITGQHDHGLNFEYRKFNAYDHPRYHIVERNIPTKHGILDPDTVGDVFGDNEISIVSSGWNDDKTYGMPTIERCSHMLMGSYSESLGIIIHRSMKSYNQDILGWVDYSKFVERVTPRSLYLLDASDEAIEIYCRNKFMDEAAAHRMTEVFKKIRDGEYINIREAALANGEDEKVASSLIREISLKSKKTIYSGGVNLQKMYELYEYVSRTNLDSAYIKMFRINIMNYVLNYPKLQSIVLLNDKFNTSQRFWFIYLMLRKCYRRDKILDPDKLPQWIVAQLAEAKDRTHVYRLNGRLVDTKSATPEEKEDYYTSLIMGLKNPEQLYPAMRSIISILDKQYLRAKKEKKQTFHDIIRAGAKWNVTEIQTVWKIFSSCYDRKKPREFWDFIYNMDNLDYEQLNDKSKGDGNTGEKKICYSRLVEARSEFREEESWTVSKPVSSAMEGKHKPKFRNRKNHFWTALLKMGGLTKDKNTNPEFISDDRIAKLIEQEQRKDELKEEQLSPSTESIIDGDEFGLYSEVDPDNGTISPMIYRGEEEWEEE